MADEGDLLSISIISIIYQYTVLWCNYISNMPSKQIFRKSKAALTS